MRGSRRRWRWRRSEGTGRSPSWRVSSECIRTRSTTGRSSCWTVPRAFSRAADQRQRGLATRRRACPRESGGRCSVPADRPVEGRKRFFGTKARQMSRAQRRTMVERVNPVLPVSQQCRLLAVSRSAVYRKPAEVSAEDLAIMALIDRQYLARPYYGSRRMAAWLATQGHVVNRKRVRRLMRLLGLVAIYPRPNTSKSAAAHKIYPYLLGGVMIERVNQVWCSDGTCIPMAKGFLYLVAVTRALRPSRDLQCPPGQPVHQRRLHRHL